MTVWVVALMLGIGVAIWAYRMLAHANGNSVPLNNVIGAAFFGFVVFLILVSFMKLILGL